jgi:WD40 repeat protein
MKYDVFISYSHAEDRKLASRLQSALARFAKPWYRIRALSVFLDASSLSANPGLWSAIESAIGQSRHFVLLASPMSARSEWVQREIEWWLANRPTSHLFIVLTNGRLVWNHPSGDFDWSETDALPEILSGSFEEEPLYVDLSWARSADEQSIRHSRFRQAVLDLAAPLRGIPKDELDSEEIRQNRRVRRLTATAITLLAALAIGATTASVIAYKQQQIAIAEKVRADEQRDLAVARELVAQARLADISGLPQRALLLATEAATTVAPVEAGTEQVLRNLLASVGGVAVPHDPQQVSAALDGKLSIPADLVAQVRREASEQADKRWRIADHDETHLALWDRRDFGADWSPILLETGRNLTSRSAMFSDDGLWLQVRGRVLFDLSSAPAEVRRYDIAIPGVPVFERFDGSRLLVGMYDGHWRLFDLTPGEAPRSRTLDMQEKRWAKHFLRFSPDGRWLFTWDQGISIWDLNTDSGVPTIIDNVRPRTVAIAPDGKAFTAYGYEAPLVLPLPPDPAARSELSADKTDHVHYSADGRWLFARPNLWRLNDGALPDSAIVLKPPTVSENWRRLRGQTIREDWRFAADDTALLQEAERLWLWRLADPVSKTPAADFSPFSVIGPDKLWLLTRESGMRSQLVNLKTLDRVDLHDSRVTAWSFAPDGNSLVVAHEDGAVEQTTLMASPAFRRIARIESAKKLRHSPGGQWLLADDVLISIDRDDILPHQVELDWNGNAEFSPDESWLVTRGSDGRTLHRYDLRPPVPSLAHVSLRGHEDKAVFDFLGDSNHWVTTGTTGAGPTRYWDLRRPTSMAAPRVLSCDGFALQGRFSPDGHWFVAHCAGHSFAVWSLSDDTAVALKFEADENLTSEPVFSPDGQWVAVSGSATYVVALKTETPTMHRIQCVNPMFGPRGRWVAMTWQGKSCIRTLPDVLPVSVPANIGALRSQSLSVSGDLIQIRSVEGKYVVYRYSRADPAELPSVLWSGAQLPRIDATGRWLTSGDGQVVDLRDSRRFNLATVPHPRTYRDVHSDSASTVSIELSPNGSWAVPVRQMREGYPEFGPRRYRTWQYLYNLKSPDPERAELSLGAPRDVKIARLVDDSGWVTIDEENVMHWVAFGTGRIPQEPVVLGELPGDKTYFSPSGKWLLNVGDDRVHLTAAGELSSESQVLSDFETNDLSQFSYRFTPDESVLVTDSAQASLIWRLDHESERYWSVRVPGRMLDISADGKWLATAHPEGVALHPLRIDTLTDLARAAAGRELSENERAEFLQH